MMNEVELKFLEIDVAATIAKLESIGAKKAFDGDMKAVYFENPAKTLREQKQVLRVRQEGDKAVVAFKQKQTSELAQVSDETEVIVSDYQTTKNIFLKLGFTVKKEFVKHRISYKLDNFSFEIDTLEGIPTFLEIEALSEDSIKEAVALLGLDLADGKDWNGFAVKEYYDKK